MGLFAPNTGDHPLIYDDSAGNIEFSTAVNFGANDVGITTLTWKAYMPSVPSGKPYQSTSLIVNSANALASDSVVGVMVAIAHDDINDFFLDVKGTCAIDDGNNLDQTFWIVKLANENELSTAGFKDVKPIFALPRINGIRHGGASCNQQILYKAHAESSAEGYDLGFACFLMNFRGSNSGNVGAAIFSLTMSKYAEPIEVHDPYGYDVG